ncbi:hypothetical protein Hanom_Chr00s001105g01673931 [Helianthus anomalus]
MDKTLNPCCKVRPHVESSLYLTDHMEATGLYFVRSPGNQQRRPEPVQEMEPEWHQKSRKDAVVYFLCKDRQLEPAHFIEVALASSEGLFLRGIHNTNYFANESNIVSFDDIVNR